jgi:hypothetical protein
MDGPGIFAALIQPPSPQPPHCPTALAGEGYFFFFLSIAVSPAARTLPGTKQIHKSVLCN